MMRQALLIGLCFLGIPHALANPLLDIDPANIYVSEISEAIRDCRESGENPIVCIQEASPARCQVEARNYIARTPRAYQAWIVCLRSCAGAGWLSETVGDCRRARK